MTHSFTSDFRESKPGLHKLYTHWAYQMLMTVENFKDEMNEEHGSNYHARDLIQTVTDKNSLKGADRRCVL